MSGVIGGMVVHIGSFGARKAIYGYPKTMQYHHTQTAPLYLLVLALSVVFFGVAWSLPELVLQVVLSIAGALMFLIAISFRELTVSDEGSELLICFWSTASISTPP